MGSGEGRRGCSDIYIVRPGYTYEICDSEKQRIKRFSFMYKDMTTFELEPILRE
jgi:hypothetical protein